MGAAEFNDRTQPTDKTGQSATCNIMSKTVAKKNVRAVSNSRHDGVSLYAADGGRKYLNLAERQRAVGTMATLDRDKALFALTLAWTGARVSEALALTPASFQIESGLVAFTTLKRRRLSVREVPLPESLIGAIDERYGLRVAQRDPRTCRVRLWTWHRTTAWRMVKDVMGRSGIVGRLACPRGLRHGFGVGTLQAGVPLNLVQRWLGHARISTTAIYADACGPEEQAFAARFWRLK
jgi:integrase/recombinase XerD